jgi:hypothetical protein
MSRTTQILCVAEPEGRGEEVERLSYPRWEAEYRLKRKEG